MAINCNISLPWCFGRTRDPCKVCITLCKADQRMILLSEVQFISSALCFVTVKDRVV